MIKQNGFTLIELLVVVAIIGILAAVGVVAYNGYTKSAKINSVKSNHSALVKFITLGVTKCDIGEEFKLKMNTGGSNNIETDRCDIVNNGDGDRLKSWLQHHFKQETLTSGSWCLVDGKKDSSGNCQEGVASGGNYGLSGRLYEHEIHSCDNSNISDCRTLVIETRYNDNEFMTNTIKF